jgi:hypothetical protein
MDIINTGTASLDLLFMTTEERTANDASRVLKKLINYILEHLDDEQAPPSIQNLCNNAFAHGFHAGYREAYKQWGEEVEERLGEAYQGGLRDGHKQCKGKQTMEPCGEPTKTTAATIEMATQTNPAPERYDAALQTEPLDDDDATALKNTCVDFSGQATPETTETATQTFVQHPSTHPNVATALLTTPAQPPSVTSSQYIQDHV